MAGDLKAQLEISADASGVEVGTNRAKKSLADLGASAKSAGKNASVGLNEIGKGGDSASKKVEAATRNMIGSIQRTTAALDAGGRSSAKYYELLANQRGVNVNTLKPYLNELDAVSKKQGVANGALGAGAIAFDKNGKSAKELQFALRGVPAQFTDIAVSLQAGQRPLSVFLQQGGQLKDMFGGIGPAFKALGGYVIGLVNPFTIAAAAAGGLAFAYSQGSDEADQYSKSLILSGNAAGLTVDQLELMAKGIDNVTGTQSAAAEALAQFASQSHVARESISDFATVAIRTQSLTGKAVSETVKQFEELGKAPVDASVKLNETTNYLTAAVYQQIKALEDQGRASDAAALAQSAYADAMNDRLDKLDGQLGIVEAGWRGIKNIAKEAWDAMLDVGRSTSITEKINQANDALVALEKSKPDSNSLFANRKDGKGYDAKRQQLLAQIQSLQYTKQQNEIDADSAKKVAEQAQARISFNKDGEKFLTKQVLIEREIAKAKNEGLKAGASQVEVAKRIADIQDKYKDKSAASAGRAIDKAKLGADVDAIKKANDQLTANYTNAEKILETVRAAGIISDAEYYESKREFIRLNAAAEEDALNQEIARYQQQRASGKDKIDNDKKIAEAQSKLVTIQASAAAQTTILANQQEAAVKKLQLSYLTARQAAQDYFDTLNKQQQRTLDGLGKGAQSRGKDAGINQIEDRYSNQRLDLENQKARLELEGKFTDDAKKQYEDRLSIIEEFQSKSIQSYSKYYEELIKKQQDFSLGAQEALQNYADQSKNAFSQAQDVVTGVFGGMEDALVDFVTKGKADFKSLANSIIADIARIIIQQSVTGPLAKSASSLFGSLFSIGLGAAGGSAAVGAGSGVSTAGLFARIASGGRASGGPVSAGSMYEVNEKGPELLNTGGKQYLMMGSQGGSVTPNGGTGGINYAPVINIDSRSDRAQVQADVQRAVAQGNAQLVDKLQRSGRL